MNRNDDNHAKPNDSQTPVDRAFSIFVQRARSENRNYFGDMVRSNLAGHISSGLNPQEAVDALFRRVRR